LCNLLIAEAFLTIGNDKLAIKENIKRRNKFAEMKASTSQHHVHEGSMSLHSLFQKLKGKGPAS
jgi:hypothetical protein